MIETQSTLAIKVLKICKEVLMDENLELIPDQKEGHTKLGAVYFLIFFGLEKFQFF